MRATVVAVEGIGPAALPINQSMTWCRRPLCTRCLLKVEKYFLSVRKCLDSTMSQICDTNITKGFYSEPQSFLNKMFTRVFLVWISVSRAYSSASQRSLFLLHAIDGIQHNAWRQHFRKDLRRLLRRTRIRTWING